jgi:hypothetical protein
LGRCALLVSTTPGILCSITPLVNKLTCRASRALHTLPIPLACPGCNFIKRALAHTPWFTLGIHNTITATSRKGFAFAGSALPANIVVEGVSGFLDELCQSQTFRVLSTYGIGRVVVVFATSNFVLTIRAAAALGAHARRNWRSVKNGVEEPSSQIRPLGTLSHTSAVDEIPTCRIMACIRSHVAVRGFHSANNTIEAAPRFISPIGASAALSACSIVRLIGPLLFIRSKRTRR